MHWMIWTTLVTAITYLCWLPFYRNPLYQDQSLHWYVGKEWLEGKIPYRDYSLGLGPCFALVYALGVKLCKKNETLFNIYSAAYVALANIFLFWTAESLFGLTSALFASLCFAFYMFNPRLVADRFPPETFVTTFLVIAFHFLVRSLASASSFWAILAGLAMGWATLTRQTAFLYLPLFLMALLWKAGLGVVTSFVCAFLLVHAFWVIYFYKKKALKIYMTRSIWHIFNAAFFGSIRGRGHPNTDPMRADKERMVTLIFNNSLSIFPLYLLSFSYLAFRLLRQPSFEITLIMVALSIGFYLITVRHNFDCCYWLNTVPWASLLAGAALGEFANVMATPAPFPPFVGYLVVVMLMGLAAYIFVFDHKLYLTLDPEIKALIFDPGKTSHASWWPSFNAIAEYIRKETKPEDRLLVIGHAIRINNRSERRAFYWQLGFVPFMYIESSPDTYEDFFKVLRNDYPEVIVLAGHMPAFPFNSEPYLQDMKKIQDHSGIIFKMVHAIDNFPIFFADTERSYIRALVWQDFRNRKLQVEKDKISALTLGLEKDLESMPAGAALINYVKALRCGNRLEELIFTVNEVLGAKKHTLSHASVTALLLHAGEAQFQKKDLPHAEQTFAMVIKTDQDCLDAYNNLGVVYSGQGRIKEARDMFEYVLSRDPYNEDGRQNLMLLDHVQ